MMKKLTATLFTLILVFTSFNLSFANDKLNESELVDQTNIYNEVPLISKDDSLERASIPGNFGTAYIGYMSGDRSFNWRLTSSKGSILNFIGTLRVYDSKGKLRTSLPVSGGGKSTLTGVKRLPSSIKKGDYRVEFTGSGQTARGSFNIGSGLTQAFTVR